MRLGFDIDGVLASVMEAWCAGFVAVTGVDRFLPRDRHEPHDYDIHTVRGYTDEDKRLFWRYVELSPTWWFDLPPLPCMRTLQAHIHELLDEHEVYFITQRRGLRVKLQTEDWLRFHLDLHHPPTVLIVGHGEKGAVAKALNLDAYVEDNFDNAVDVMKKSPTTRIFLVNRRYNQWEHRWPSGVPNAEQVSEYWTREKADRSRVSGIGEMLRTLNLIPYNSRVE